MNDLRFDLEARVEVFVTAEEIRGHDDFAHAMAEPNIPEAPIGTNPRLVALREIARNLAERRIVEHSNGHLEITAYPTFADVNIDRINWQELAAHV